MAYRIVLESVAAKTFDKLDKPIKNKIQLFIDTLAEVDNPRAKGIAMQGAGQLWRYRVGDYRLIANINDNIITITILKIGHRREVYR